MPIIDVRPVAVERVELEHNSWVYLRIMAADQTPLWYKATFDGFVLLADTAQIGMEDQYNDYHKQEIQEDGTSPAVH